MIKIVEVFLFDGAFYKILHAFEHDNQTKLVPELKKHNKYRRYTTKMPQKTPFFECCYEHQERVANGCFTVRCYFVECINGLHLQKSEVSKSCKVPQGNYQKENKVLLFGKIFGESIVKNKINGENIGRQIKVEINRKFGVVKHKLGMQVYIHQINVGQMHQNTQPEPRIVEVEGSFNNIEDFCVLFVEPIHAFV